MLDYLLNKRNYRYFALAWAIIIFTISTIPNLPQPDIEESSGISIRFDYLFHFVVYFILGTLVIVWQTDHKARLNPKTYLVTLSLGILFGFADEWHQVLIPGRRFNPIDFYLNAIGYLTGFLFTYHYLIHHLAISQGKFQAILAKLYPKLNDQLFSPEK
jgi:VanZ family protein